MLQTAWYPILIALLDMLRCAERVARTSDNMNTCASHDKIASSRLPNDETLRHTHWICLLGNPDSGSNGLLLAHFSGMSGMDSTLFPLVVLPQSAVLEDLG